MILESFIVEPECEGQRLDVYLTSLLSQLSRSRVRDAITAGQVKVDERTAKPSYKIVAGQKIECEIESLPVEGPIPEDIPLDILYDDKDVAVINKPPGMVVHPSKGHWQGTLTAALAFHFQNLSECGGATRPGIVHRLDRDTSGVIVIAKNDNAHLNLSKQFEQRDVEKEYLAIVSPPPDRERDWIEQPIGPHPYQREKMAIRTNHPQAREANTFYEVTKKIKRFAVVKVLPRTGRTHQIRVHFQHIGCPIIADKLYSGHSQISRKDLGLKEEGDQENKPLLERQALHARRLVIHHPATKKQMEFVAPIPSDLKRLIDALDELKESF